MYALQVVERLVVEPRRRGLAQDLTESGQAAKRRAQIVGDGVGKRFELAIRRFELLRSLFDARFELCVHALHLGLRCEECLHSVLIAPLIASQEHVDQER